MSSYSKNVVAGVYLESS